MNVRFRPRTAVAALLALLGSPWAPVVLASSSRKTSDIDAYSRRVPPTPAQAPDRWVKIWHDGRSWHIAWAATVTTVNHRGRTRALKLDIKGRVDRVGDGEIGAVNIGRKGRGEIVDKIEHNEKAILFEALLTPMPRAISFSSTAEALRFNFIVDGRRHPKDILIGEKGVNPKRMPFTLVTPKAAEELEGGRRRRRKPR